MPKTASQLGIVAPKGGFQDLGWYPSKTGGSYQYHNGTFGESGAIHPGSPQVGAGQVVSDTVNRQSDAAAGYAPDTIKNYLNLGSLPKFSNPGDAANFANAGQSNFGGLPGVQSREQIAADLKNELNLPDRPEVPSMLDTYKTQRTEAGLDTMQQEINDLTSQERDLVAQNRQRVANEENKPEALGVIAGRVSEAERQSAERLDTIQRQKAYKVDQYNSALSSVQMIMNFTQQDYTNATDSFNSQFSQGLQMIDAVSGIQRDQKTDAQRAQDNANATLGVMMNAITSGNLNYNDISSDQKLNISKMEARAGLPIGFVSNLHMSPGDKILNINSDTGEALMVDDNGNFQVKRTGMTISPKGLTAGQQKIQEQANVVEAINTVRGQDGYIDPKDWNKLLEQWIVDGGSRATFENNFSQYANPNHLASYGLDKSKSVTLNL